jgi:DNA-binding MarR family transcriptional regulator
VKRIQDPNDKRSLLVYPTEKMLEAFPEIRRIAREWNSALIEDIDEEELRIFESVLEKMERRAVELAFGNGSEDGK